MKVKFLLSTLFFALLLPTANAQDPSSNMGVVVQNSEDNADKSIITVHLTLHKNAAKPEEAKPLIQ
jgi:hypothetical protein